MNFNLHVLGLIVAVMSSACFATNPYSAGTSQAKLWDSIDTNFIVLKGPPAQLQWSSSGQMHDALRQLDSAMGGINVEVQIDSFPSDDASPALLKTATITRGESSAYADGGNYTSSLLVNGGAATSSATAPTCIACAIGGKTEGSVSSLSSASTGGAAEASTNNSDSSAIAQGGDESSKGGAARATSTGSNSHATAFGGNATKSCFILTPTAHFVGLAGGQATAQSTATSIAHGGKGAPVSGTGNISGDGGDAIINGGANSSTETATGGDHGNATNGATAGADGTATVNQ